MDARDLGVDPPPTPPPVLTYARSPPASSEARFLRDELGVVPGDRVAVLSSNACSVLAALGPSQGAVVLNLNTHLVAREMAHILRDSGAIAILARRAQHARVLREVFRVEADEEAGP